MPVEDLKKSLEKLVRESVKAIMTQTSFEKKTTWSVDFRQEGTGDKPADIEMIIYFEDENGVFDVIEYGVVRNGKSVASVDEIQGWLSEDLKSVIEGNNSPDTHPKASVNKKYLP